MEDHIINWVFSGVVFWTTTFMVIRKLFPKRTFDFCNRIVSTIHASLAVCLASLSVQDWSCPVCPVASRSSPWQVYHLLSSSYCKQLQYNSMGKAWDIQVHGSISESRNIYLDYKFWSISESKLWAFIVHDLVSDFLSSNPLADENTGSVSFLSDLWSDMLPLRQPCQSRQFGSSLGQYYRYWSRSCLSNCKQYNLTVRPCVLADLHCYAWAMSVWLFWLAFN